MAGPDRTGPGPTDDDAPPDHRPSHRRHKPSPGAPSEVVDHFTELAGDGSVDQRCARILAIYRDVWFGQERR